MPTTSSAASTSSNSDGVISESAAQWKPQSLQEVDLFQEALVAGGSQHEQAARASDSQKPGLAKRLPMGRSTSGVKAKNSKSSNNNKKKNKTKRKSTRKSRQDDFLAHSLTSRYQRTSNSSSMVPSLPRLHPSLVNAAKQREATPAANKQPQNAKRRNGRSHKNVPLSHTVEGQDGGRSPINRELSVVLTDADTSASKEQLIAAARMRHLRAIEAAALQNQCHKSQDRLEVKQLDAGHVASPHLPQPASMADMEAQRLREMEHARKTGNGAFKKHRQAHKIGPSGLSAPPHRLKSLNTRTNTAISSFKTSAKPVIQTGRQRKTAIAKNAVVFASFLESRRMQPAVFHTADRTVKNVAATGRDVIASFSMPKKNTNTVIEDADGETNRDRQETGAPSHVPSQEPCAPRKVWNFEDPVHFHSPWLTFGLHRMFHSRSEACRQRWAVVQSVIESELHVFSRLRRHDALRAFPCLYADVSSTILAGKEVPCDANTQEMVAAAHKGQDGQFSLCLQHWLRDQQLLVNEDCKEKYPGQREESIRLLGALVSILAMQGSVVSMSNESSASPTVSATKPETPKSLRDLEEQDFSLSSQGEAGRIVKTLAVLQQALPNTVLKAVLQDVGVTLLANSAVLSPLVDQSVGDKHRKGSSSRSVVQHSSSTIAFRELCSRAIHIWGTAVCNRDSSDSAGSLFVVLLNAACRAGRTDVVSFLLRINSEGSISPVTASAADSDSSASTNATTPRAITCGIADAEPQQLHPDATSHDFDLPPRQHQCPSEFSRRTLAHIINAENGFEPAPLAQAVAAGHISIVRLLVLAGASGNATAGASVAGGHVSGTFSLVHLAVSFGHFHVLEYLLRLGVDGGLRAACNVSPLEIGVFWGMHDVVAPLVRSSTTGDAHGSTASSGVYIDHTDPRTGNTLAMTAMLNGDFDILQLLVDAGASLHRQNNFGLNLREMLRVFYLAGPGRGQAEQTLEQVLALGTTMRVQWKAERRDLTSVARAFQVHRNARELQHSKGTREKANVRSIVADERHHRRLLYRDLCVLAGGSVAVCVGDADEGASTGQSSHLKRHRGKTILQLVCTQTLRYTVNDPDVSEADENSVHVVAEGEELVPAPPVPSNGAAKGEVTSENLEARSFTFTDVAFWMGYLTRLRCFHMHQRSLEATTFHNNEYSTQSSSKTAIDSQLRGCSTDTDLDILNHIRLGKFAEHHTIPSHDVATRGALDAWAAVSSCRVWTASDLSTGVHSFAPLLVQAKSEFRHSLRTLKRVYCVGVVNADNRACQHSAWRRILGEAFDQQQRNSLMLHEIRLTEQRQKQERHARKKRKKRASGDRHESPSDRKSLMTTTTKEAKSSKIAEATRATLPREVMRPLHAAEKFADSKAAQCMTALHELENLHRYLRRQLPLFHSDFTAQIDRFLHQRHLQETTRKNKRLAAKFAAEQAARDAQDAREAALDSDEDGDGGKIRRTGFSKPQRRKAPVVLRNDSHRDGNSDRSSAYGSWEADDPLCDEMELLALAARGRIPRIRTMLANDFQKRVAGKRRMDHEKAKEEASSPTARAIHSTQINADISSDASLEEIRALQHGDVLQKTFGHHINLNYCHVSGHTPLLCAVLNGDSDLVQMLLAAGANMDQISTIRFQNVRHRFSGEPEQVSFSTYPLLLAVLLENLEIVRVLLLWGADANLVLPDGLSAVHVAAFHARDADAAAAASLHDSKVVMTPGPDSSSAKKSFTNVDDSLPPARGQLFQLLCRPSTRHMATQKSEVGALDNAVDSLDNGTSIQLNAPTASTAQQSSGYAEGVLPRFVEERYAARPLNVGNRVFIHGHSCAGVTPLHVAAFFGRQEVLELLLSASDAQPQPPLGVKRKSNNDSDCSSGSSQSNVLDMARFLVTSTRGGCCELDVTQRTVDGYSAVRMALFTRSIHCVETLLKFGALTDVPLTKSVSQGHVGSGRLSDSYTMSSATESTAVLTAACFQGIPAVVRALLASDCLITVDALVVAATLGDYDILCLLYDAIEADYQQANIICSTANTPERRASWAQVRDVVHAERNIDAEDADRTRKRALTLSSAVYRSVAARVGPILKTFHGLDLYTARLIGDHTRGFLQQRETEWKDQATKLFAESPSWFLTLSEPVSAVARRQQRKLASARFQRVSDARHVSRLLLSLVNDMHLRSFVETYAKEVFSPEASPHHNAALSLARSHSEATIANVLTPLGEHTSDSALPCTLAGADVRSGELQLQPWGPASALEQNSGAPEVLPVFKSDFEVLYLQVMRYKSLERRRLLIDARVERATTLLQKMARMWNVTGATGRERFRSLRCIRFFLCVYRTTPAFCRSI